jgi:phenylacetate-CoA ligase
LSTYLHGAGILKINLKPEDWKAAQHRQAYLEKYNPQILTGEPFAFMDLMQLNAKITPKALVSSAMKLNEGLKVRLEAHFGCPVIDIYSLTECRMISFAENGRHRAIRPELYLEVFDSEKDILLPYGSWGELVVTGGNNPFLPLVRYRTGDFCSLQVENGIPYLYDLEARNPVAFYTKTRKLINPIEISRAMMSYPLVGFKLHQNVNHELLFTGWSQDPIQKQVNQTLQQIFGTDLNTFVEILPASSHTTYKNVSYTSDLGLPQDRPSGS